MLLETATLTTWKLENTYPQSTMGTANHDLELTNIRNQTSTKLFDDLISTKMKDLSIQERSDGLYDLHGVSELKEENEEMIQKKLTEMNNALSVITTYHTSTQAAYKQAVVESPTYVEKLKIPCLRAEEYNSQEAAGRLIRYFERKMELFGEEKLVKDLKFEDLDEKDAEALERGVFQVLPLRDRAGRAILFIHGALSLLYETKTVMRVFFYLAMSALQDKETQMRGAVFIYHAVDQKRVAHDRPPEYWKNWISMLWRVVGSHYCVPKSVPASLAPIFIFRMMKNKNVCRARVHPGTAMECIYNLMTFGIPKDSLPIDVNDKMDLTSHHSMLQILRHREEESKQSTNSDLKTKDISDSTSASIFQSEESIIFRPDNGSNNSLTGTILIPDPMDVLLGRGRHPQSRPGSLRLRNLLLKYRDTYDKGTKGEKMTIAKNILKEMKAMGSRFLDSGPYGYTECTDLVAKKKISHAFRNMRLKKTNSTRSSSSRVGTDDGASSSSSSGGGDNDNKKPSTTNDDKTNRKRSFDDKNGNEKGKYSRET